ncbi:MAG: 2-amino-4-hydroxy-6-hydroxymethyldihydropteridine diphosphokinase [Candidatus Dormibacteraeota bacterium]|nr:2-amino-4-hydroxy-6-hydroxymethyldihydropteridine diphosphokinase [Candidatus Dormibacteraeota bacterium]
MTTDVAWVTLGSNLGNRGRALAVLRQHLALDGVVIEATSSEILTRPIGVSAQGDFHNQLLRLRAPQPWSAQRWLEHTRAAELAAGRRDTYHWGPRRADVDIILLGEKGDLRVNEPNLVVPHPEIENRPFITRLLTELGRRPRGS